MHIENLKSEEISIWNWKRVKWRVADINDVFLFISSIINMSLVALYVHIISNKYTIIDSLTFDQLRILAERVTAGPK